MLKQAFGKHLRFLREREGLTQEQLAELSGLSDRQIRNYESGRQSPQFDNLEKLRKALDISIRELFDFDYHN